MTPLRLAAITLVLVVVSSPTAALATFDDPGPAFGTVQEPAGPDQPQPAVELEDESEDPKPQDWTFRYLVPTALVLSGLTIVASLALYGVRVRARYRVVK
ncbi:MAG: hypothetical protein ACE5KX_01375 [Acidimicrobiia bacterium]